MVRHFPPCNSNDRKPFSGTARANIPIAQTIARLYDMREQERDGGIALSFRTKQYPNGEKPRALNYPSDLTDDEWAHVGPLIRADHALCQEAFMTCRFGLELHGRGHLRNSLTRASTTRT